MNLRDAGRRGGSSRSPAKQAAARKNGTRGGRPQKTERLVRQIREARERVHLPGVDPADVDLIIESVLRRDDPNRRFFLYPRPGGGFGF